MRRVTVPLCTEARAWLDRSQTLRKPVGLRQHSELFVAAGWLALLVGCLEDDLGMRVAAESVRTPEAVLLETFTFPLGQQPRSCSTHMCLQPAEHLCGPFVLEVGV